MSSSLSSLVLKSSGILFLLRFVQRGIGLISTLIMARLLTPEDFGLIAIIALIVHFCEILSTTGTEQYLVQKTETEDDDLYSAWTLDIMLKSGLWILIILTAPFIDKIYPDVSLTIPLIFASSVLVINALKNPALALLKKAFTYRKIFYLSLVQKLVGFTFGITIVMIHKTYWAILVIDVVAALVMTIGSYVIHEFRPKVSFKKVKEQFAFSKWLLLKGGIGYIRAQIDVIFVTRLFSPDVVGSFHLARHIAVLPSSELIAPVAEPLLASFARVKANLHDVGYQFNLSLLFVLSLVGPICCYFFFFAPSVIDVLLGSKLKSAHELLSAMSLTVLVFSIGPILSACCVALGKVKQVFYYDMFSLVFAVLCLMMLVDYNIREFILARGAVALIPLIALLMFMRTFIPLSLKLSLFNSIVIALCCAVATYVGLFIESLLPVDTNIVLVLLSLGSTFFLTYLITLLVLVLFLRGKTEIWAAYARIITQNAYSYMPAGLKKYLPANT
ncbi:oligosaccharide flippase family protein [Glaciecola petra]|uniref:Oligosaccharide flippase family protein n=1 Tax=Glaciecola petra TaxID=3075602 RepID=A0ABU2ZLV0_9ALTE|nr:oligosaccharide flippase family protein [Aestuariibacter sp. P117]MDT0593605.1 oligosaccharide flippase family protein [Aestuariibacter sp. P117]